MDWIGLAQDRDKWRPLVNAVMTLRVSQNAENFSTSCKPEVSVFRHTHTHSQGNATLYQHLDCIKTKVSLFNLSLKFGAKTSSFPGSRTPLKWHSATRPHYTTKQQAAGPPYVRSCRSYTQTMNAKLQEVTRNLPSETDGRQDVVKNYPAFFEILLSINLSIQAPLDTWYSVHAQHNLFL
jgi:hypothetical protein